MNRDEKGIALVLVLIMLGVLSVIASSMVFVAQSETWASQNYRVMSEARYGAESAVHRASNFILYSYTVPDTAALGVYDITTSPVRFGGSDVRLGTAGASNCVSNYPVSADVAAFQAAASGTLQGSHTMTYDTCATLIAMRQVTEFASTTPRTVQTWRIVGEARIGGARPAHIEVSAILERQVMPMFAYAAFATDDTCGSASGSGGLSWLGGGSTDSYDSTTLAAGTTPVPDPWGGNVGTNGNLYVGGGTTVVNGTLSTPRSGVGACSSGSVTAYSGSSAAIQGDPIQLPQRIDYPPPSPPNPLPPVGNMTIHSPTTLPPGDYGDITVNAGEVLTLQPGTYNINSIKLNGGAQIVLQPGDPIIMNVAGTGIGANQTVIDFSGGSVSGALFDPIKFQILYAGVSTVKMAGSGTTAALLYAPNAFIDNQSAGADWYGAVIGKAVKDAGHAQIHYDRALASKAMMVGPWMLNSFNWSRF